MLGNMKKFASMMVILAGFSAGPALRPMLAQQKQADQAVPKQAVDPVCGMKVDPKAKETQKSEYKGKTYYFCSREDKASFDKSPDQYASKAEAKKK